MAKLSFVVAILAVLGAASAKSTKSGKSYAVRATCVNSNGQLQPEGSTWFEGVNGCLAITCLNGTSMGVSSCTCTYPDGTIGKDNDVYFSIPTCTTCTCLSGMLTCSPLLNCLLPPTSTVTIAPTATFTCAVPEEGITLNAGDMYIADGHNCTCTAAGLLCVGVTVLPTITGMPTDMNNGQCFMGFLGFVDTSVTDEVVPNGYVFTDECNVCVCTDGIFICEYICTAEITDTPIIEPTIMVPAALDCDVGEGIVLNGDPYTSDCGASCVCVNGDLQCEACPTTGGVTPTGPSEIVCLATTGEVVANGQAYMADECTNCTCINGVFTCVKVCRRDCTTSSGVITHGSTKTTTCQSCKCNDATLTCSDKCAGKSCKVPNSKNTVPRGQSEKVDKCNTCKCSDNLVLTCTSKCSSSSYGCSCVCNGRTLRSGKSTTSKCEKCTCKDGKVTCKKTC